MKILVFGQIGLLNSTNFDVWNNFLSTPTLQPISVKQGAIPKEQLDLAVRSNTIRYLDEDLKELFYWWTEAHQFLWPIIPCISIILIISKPFQMSRFKLFLKQPMSLLIFGHSKFDVEFRVDHPRHPRSEKRKSQLGLVLIKKLNKKSKFKINVSTRIKSLDRTKTFRKLGDR